LSKTDRREVLAVTLVAFVADSSAGSPNLHRCAGYASHVGIQEF
jgi:hypothetical protein